MTEFKKFECIIEVTSDWANIEFRGAELFSIDIAVLEGENQHIEVNGNKVSFTLPEQRVVVPDARGTIPFFFVKVKLSSLIPKNKNIISIMTEKGDIGKIDIEIGKCHFENSINLPTDCRNGKEIMLTDVVSIFDEQIEEKPKRKELDYPTILIVTPTKNDAIYLPRHLEAWNKVDYPREKIRWIWMYGNSNDDTLEILEKYFSEGKWNSEIYAEPKFTNLIPDSALWIADVMNAFKNLYKEEDFVVIDDSDIVGISPNLLNELLKFDLDMVAPYVWHDGRVDDFFDTYVFRGLDGVRYSAKNVPYLNMKHPVELSSVGTMVLMKGKIFQTIDFENPCPTLQFCRNAKKKGYRIWATPWIKIFHADVWKEKRESHFSPEHYVENGTLPKSVLEKLR